MNKKIYCIIFILIIPYGRLYSGMIQSFSEQQSITTDKKYVWVAASVSSPHLSSNAFLFKLDKKNKKWESVDIKDFIKRPITSLLVNNEDIWIGTYGDGLSHFNGQKWSKYTVENTGTIHKYGQKDGLAGNYISSIKLLNNSIWCGTNYGISRYIKNNNEWITYTHENSKVPKNSFNILATDNKRIWVASSNYGYVWYEQYPADDERGGILFFDTKKEKWNIYTGKHKTFQRDKLKSIEEGNSPLPSCDIKGIDIFNGHIWFIIGSAGFGLGHLDLNNDNKWEFFSADHYKYIKDDTGKTKAVKVEGNSKLPSNSISAIEIGKDDIWVATSKGLCKISKNNEWEIFTSKENPSLPPRGYIKSMIIDDDGGLWINSYDPNFWTEQGISKDLQHSIKLKNGGVHHRIHKNGEIISIKCLDKNDWRELYNPGYMQFVSYYKDGKWETWEITRMVIEKITENKD